MNLLVTGGTGILGRRVVGRLSQRGHAVRVLTRQTSPDLPPGVVAVRGDMTTGEGLGRAADDVGGIVHCASATGSLRDRPDDVDGTRRLIHAARATGSPHLVFISIVGIDDHPMPYYRMKRAAEEETRPGDSRTSADRRCSGSTTWRAPTSTPPVSGVVSSSYRCPAGPHGRSARGSTCVQRPPSARSRGSVPSRTPVDRRRALQQRHPSHPTSVGEHARQGSS